ncbi:MAG: peptidylprolyl isomerase [Rhizobiaceae bacterium]|nr:MAG: peptidylprolyl isomerase [Rhizobiaceae bacterium]
MLDSMRNAAGSWVAKLFFIVLVVSFAGWGISGRITGGFSGSDVLTVGDTTVSGTDYRLAYERQINVLSQQLGTRLTAAQAKNFGVEQQVLSQLLAGAVLDEEARRIGLGVSQARIATLTREDPAFHGSNGQFDRRQFEYVLQQISMRPEDYFRNRQSLAVRQQIVDSLTDGMKVPDTFLQAFSLYTGEDRTVEFVTLPRSLVEPIDKPSDAVLSAWFEKNKKNYAAPEYRKISYVRMDPADVADPSSVSDDQVKKDYEAHKSLYTTAEQRTIEQIVFKDKNAAKAAEDAIKNGASFEDIMKQQGKSEADVLLGTFQKAGIPDQKIADAAFGLKANEVSPVVDGSFGPVLLRVTAIKPAETKPLSAVAAEIRKNLALAEANKDLLDIHDSFEDARAGGATLKEAAEKFKLKYVTIDAIDRAGRRPDDAVDKDIPASEKLLKEAFSTEPNIDNDPITTKENGFVYYQVDSIDPAHDRKLAEVHDKALKDWTDEQAHQRLGAKAEALLKELKGGKSLDQIASSLKLEKQIKRGVKRSADDPDLGATGVAAVFGVKNGGTGVVPGADENSQILFKVTEVFEPAAAGADAVPAAQQKAFGTGMANDMLNQLITMLQARYGVKVNQQAIKNAQAD